MFDQYQRWPEFQFKNRSHMADGKIAWIAHMTDETGVKARRVCQIVGKNGAWTVPAFDGTTPQPNLGSFKRREEAVAAFLRVTEYEPETLELKEALKNVEWTNGIRPKEALSEDVAGAIWDILVEECGASNEGVINRAYFIHSCTTDGGPSEFRFGGAIGFGGKGYFSTHRGYVSCYAEEESPYVNLMIARANTRLQALYLKTWGKR